MQRQRQKGVGCFIRGLQLNWPAARGAGRSGEAGGGRLTAAVLSLSSAYSLLSVSVSPASFGLLCCVLL